METVICNLAPTEPVDSKANVTKVGFKIPISWEALYGSERKGHYEPTGIKWVQWLSWLMGLIVFKLWAGLEKTLRKFRHFEGVWGYEYEEAEYRPFKQKQKWVEDGSDI